MARWFKLILWCVGGALAAVAVGWFWGASGKAELKARAQSAELKADVLGARSHLLQARVDLYNVNFGDASRHMEAAKASLATVTAKWRETGSSDAADKTAAVIARVDEAQQLAGKLDTAANTRAGTAITLLDAVPLTVR